jgi:Hg(II)-responsive transcriptional regulator
MSKLNPGPASKVKSILVSRRGWDLTLYLGTGPILGVEAEVRGDRLRIGGVARRAGVNIQTLRYYERRGLLQTPARTPSGYREYPADAVRLVRFIKRAQDLGFTLKEVSELIALRDAAGRRRAGVRALAEAKIRDIERKLAQLEAMRGALSTLVRSCACAGAKPVCPILEALDDSAGEAASREPVAAREGR